MKEDIQEKNIQLLNYMRVNAEMGVNTLFQINSITENTRFKEVIASQLLEYKSVLDYSDKLLKTMEAETKSVSKMLKFSSYLMINMKTIMDKSPSRIAEMIINGGTMGIIDITKKLKEYVCCDNEVRNIGYKLMWIEQKNVDEMKHFL